MRALIRALCVLALPAIAGAAPSPAAAQYDPYRDGTRWGGAPPWIEQAEASRSARDLADGAARLQRAIQRVEGDSELSERTARFARAADIFARSVDSRAPYPQLMESFDALQREYHDVRGAFFAEHRTHHIEEVVDDWTRVVGSFERLALDLGVEESQLCVLDGRSRPYYGYSDGDRTYDDRYDRRYSGLQRVPR